MVCLMEGLIQVKCIESVDDDDAATLSITALLLLLPPSCSSSDRRSGACSSKSSDDEKMVKSLFFPPPVRICNGRWICYAVLLLLICCWLIATTRSPEESLCCERPRLDLWNENTASSTCSSTLYRRSVSNSKARAQTHTHVVSSLCVVVTSKIGKVKWP